MKRIENQVNHIDMKQVIFVFAALLLMASCGKKGEDATPSSPSSGTGTTDTTTVKTFVQPHIDGDPQSDEYVIARVNAIYDNIFTENYRIISDEEEEFVSDDTLSPDEKFCTTDWNDLLSKVYEFDSTNSPDDQGLLDFDYWAWVSDEEDWGKLSISDVTLVKREKEHSVVEFYLQNKNDKTHVRLDLKFERGEWFIDDITDLDNDFDMRKEMKEYIKSPQQG